MHALDKRHDRRRGQRRAIEIGNHRRFDRLGHIAPSVREPGQAAVGAVLGLIEARGIGIGQFAGDIGQRFGPLMAAHGAERPAAVFSPGVATGFPAIADCRQARLAVAAHEEIDELGQRFRVLAQGPPAMMSGSASERSAARSGMPARSSIVRMLLVHISY